MTFKVHVVLQKQMICQNNYVLFENKKKELFSNVNISGGSGNCASGGAGGEVLCT